MPSFRLAARIGAKSIDVLQVLHIGPTIVMPVHGGRAQGLSRRHPFDAFELARQQALARSSIHLVTCVSAGPPCGGLYLIPPSSGGLCEGVITMPSLWPDARPRL